MNGLLAGTDAANRRPEIWCDLTDLRERDDEYLSAVLTASVSVLVVCPDVIPELPLPTGARLACLVSEASELEASTHCDVTVVRDDGLIEQALIKNMTVAAIVTLSDGPSVRRACDLLKQVNYLLIDRSSDVTNNIPVELLVAEAQHTGCLIIKTVETSADAMVALNVLECGVHGVVFKGSRLAEIKETGRLVTDLATEKLDLNVMTVTRVRQAGLGYRACIDTTTMFSESEGILVGSTSSGAILVAAEVHPLPYMKARPFRVNAGALHSYAWLPENRTNYLSELEAGSPMLAVSTEGFARPIVVGRTKIEVRPMRLIEASSNGTTVNVILQDDWHVRLFDGLGQVVNSTRVGEGDQLLGYVACPGRHMGIAIGETIVER